MLPLLLSIPHAGEKIPDAAKALANLPENVLMGDVDRYVDQLYGPAFHLLNQKPVVTEWHRYVVDLNRVPADTDKDSLENSPNASGSFPRGYHWSLTTHREALISRPYTQKEHQELTKLIYEPFHQQIASRAQEIFSTQKEQALLFHMDLHSMPSVGTAEHRDPGELRADIVVSDFHGKSCHALLRDLVIVSYVCAGFKVGYNWPYYGGRITERYGRPQAGHHAIQVELNRRLYMNETTKAKGPDFHKIQEKITQALVRIAQQLPQTLARMRQEPHA